MSDPLLVVDAPSLLFRAHFALPDSITDAEGQPVNALLGTTNLILLELERRPARAVILCFGEEAATYRTELYAGYHADREDPPEPLARQFADAPDFFDALGWTTLTVTEVEPDDVLGSLARIETDAGGESLILTGDRDMFIASSRLIVSAGGRASRTLLATAGDRLALEHLRWTGGAPGRDCSGPAGRAR